MFDKLDYKKWCLDNRINELFGIDLSTYGTVQRKASVGIFEAANPKNKAPYPPELDDLTRLHFLVRSRKVSTILEFGVGKSTLVFADAISKNKEEYGEFYKANIRRSTPFEINVVENGKEWIKTCKKSFPKELLSFVNFNLSEAEMTTFNGRACTMYKKLPNVCPDLIYLDGPDQWAAKNDVRGISDRTVDRLPMSADILLMEPYLLPGTLIVIDGRTANARFLKNNLQRNWDYKHYRDEDISTFELIESPLGKYNETQIRFCLGDNAPQLKKINNNKYNHEKNTAT